jgi:parallel beta-helix repeat protein
MTNANHMNCPDSQIHQSTIVSAQQTKIFASTLAWRTGLAALLVVASGIAVLSVQPNKAIAQTTTPQTPASPTDTPSITPQTPANPTGNTSAPQSGTDNRTLTPIAPVPTTGKVIYVNPQTGSDSAGANTSEATPAKTITAALNQAQPGTVIQLAPGNYTSETGEVFPLTIKPGVILRGDESSKGQNIVITGGGNFVSPSFARQNVTVLAEKDTTISGVTITNPNTRGTALWIESTNPTVTNNTFVNSNRDGIFITGTATPKIESNVFTKNGGNGISVARAAGGEIRNNVFESTGFGLAIGGTSTPLVENNQIRQNKDGIYISESGRPILRNNVIEKNDRDGVVATVNAQPDLGTAESSGQNSIRGNKRYAVYNATRNNTLVAVGNDIDRKKISGKVDFVAAQIALRDIKGLWAQPYIEALASQKIIAGFPDGTFRPDEPVTRAQFATIVSKAFAPQSQRQAVNFKDVSPKFWANQAIQTAYRGGFVAGYPGGLFQPEQAIPRVQALVSLANGLKLSANNPKAISVYTDAAQIPEYATGAVAAATQRQLVVNYPTPSQLNPNREASRAEIAAFVYQALVNSGRVKPIPSPYLVRVP